MQLLGYLVCACAEYGHGSLCLELRIGVGKAVDSLDEVGCALAFVGHLLRNEQHYAALFGQSHLQACCGTVFRAEDVRVDGVRNRHNLLAREQSALLCLRFEPAAARYEVDIAVVVERLLALPYLAREVVGRASAGQQLAVVAHGAEGSAAACVVADAGGRPEVVHGPHDGLSALHNLAD